jgi:hypothetical protein
MTNKAKITTLAFSLAVLLSASGSAGASSMTSQAEARRIWAERHVDLVCRPLAARGLRERARRCYGDVARAVRDPAQDFSDVTASLPPVRPVGRSAPLRTSGALAAEDRPARCAGVACLQLFTSLGVGY